MTDNVREMIHAAHSLDGGREANNELYRRWASTYDQHLMSDAYVGPHMCALLTQQVATADVPDVLDVGCGTGLVGRELDNLMPQARVVGADLSVDMTDVADASGTYDKTYADIDLNEPLPAELTNKYPIIVCCGTFSLGHVKIGGIEHLIDAAPQGGYVILSVRKLHSDNENFASAVNALVDSGLVEKVSELLNAPYIKDEGADYWTLRKL